MTTKEILALIPRKVGTSNSFVAHGKTFYAKRLSNSKDGYYLDSPLTTPRCRWGTRKEIAEDIASIFETGVLPGKAGHP